MLRLGRPNMIRNHAFSTFRSYGHNPTPLLPSGPLCSGRALLQPYICFPKWKQTLQELLSKWFSPSLILFDTAVVSRFGFLGSLRKSAKVNILNGDIASDFKHFIRQNIVLHLSYICCKPMNFFDVTLDMKIRVRQKPMPILFRS